MANKRLLISYAHPDDESFGSGGLIAKYVQSGVDVYLICATDGDRGTLPAEFEDQYDTIRELRLSELDCAAEKLGMKAVFKLGYRDSGMMTDDTINDPDCLWYQWNNNRERVLKDVVQVIRQVKPHVILTFNRYGGYGHPDHIAIQQATTEAFDLAADAAYDAVELPPYQPQKLYFSQLPRRMLQFMLWMMRLRGQNPREMGVNKDLDFVKVLENAEPSTTMINIKDHLDDWVEASACHQSQGGGGMINGYPRWLSRILFGKQGLSRVIPQPSRQRVDETDLFAGVTVD